LKRLWRLEKYDIAKNEFHPLSSTLNSCSENEARAKAEEVLKNLDLTDAGDDYSEDYPFSNIRIYIVRPNGTKYRFVSDK